MTSTVRFAMCTLTAAVLAGCSQTFPIQELTAHDRSFEQSLLTERDSDSRIALGQMYFRANRIDEADAVLAPVVAADPRNAQALAWYGANNCKIAARKGPWLMGLDKLYLVNACLNQVEQALALAPGDFTVQMVHMETGLSVDKFGSLDRAAATQQQVERSITANPKLLPPDALAQFDVTSARIERKRGNDAQAVSLLERASTRAQAPATRDSIEVERALLGSR